MAPKRKRTTRPKTAPKKDPPQQTKADISPRIYANKHKWTIQEEEKKLINCVLDASFIYDMAHTDYLDTLKKDRFLEGLAEQMNIPPKEVKAKWKGYRTQFTKHINEVKATPSSSGALPKLTARKKWLFTKLEFLRKHSRGRRHTSNLAMKSTRHSATAQCQLAEDNVDNYDPDRSVDDEGEEPPPDWQFEDAEDVQMLQENPLATQKDVETTRWSDVVAMGSGYQSNVVVVRSGYQSDVVVVGSGLEDEYAAIDDDQVQEVNPALEDDLADIAQVASNRPSHGHNVVGGDKDANDDDNDFGKPGPKGKASGKVGKKTSARKAAVVVESDLDESRGSSPTPDEKTGEDDLPAIRSKRPRVDKTQIAQNVLNKFREDWTNYQEKSNTTEQTQKGKGVVKKFNFVNYNEDSGNGGAKADTGGRSKKVEKYAEDYDDDNGAGGSGASNDVPPPTKVQTTKTAVRVPGNPLSVLASRRNSTGNIKKVTAKDIAAAKASFEQQRVDLLKGISDKFGSHPTQPQIFITPPQCPTPTETVKHADEAADDDDIGVWGKLLCRRLRKIENKDLCEDVQDYINMVVKEAVRGTWKPPQFLLLGHISLCAASGDHTPPHTTVIIRSPAIKQASNFPQHDVSRQGRIGVGTAGGFAQQEQPLMNPIRIDAVGVNISLSGANADQFQQRQVPSSSASATRTSSDFGFNTFPPQATPFQQNTGNVFSNFRHPQQAGMDIQQQNLMPNQQFANM